MCPPQEDPAWVKAFEHLPPLSDDDKDFESDSTFTFAAPAKRIEKKSSVQSASSEWIPTDAADEIQASEPIKKTAKKNAVVSKRKAKKKAPRNELTLIAASRLDTEMCLLQSDGESRLGFSGDVGVIGRVKVGTKEDDTILDLKGILYHAFPYASNTACVVTMGGNEAKITSVFNSVVHLIGEANNDDMDMEMMQENADENGMPGAKKMKEKKRKPATKRKAKKGK